MKHRNDDPDRLSQRDLVFVERLEREYRADPPSSAHRDAFDRELAERLARRGRLRLVPPALAAVAFTALFAWVLLPNEFEPASSPVPAAARGFTVAEWEEGLFDGSVADDSDDVEPLPEEYAAIAVFLDG